MKGQPRSDDPYIGLVPYETEDAALFFGREAEQGIIRDNLIASRLTILYGQSGVGKSSVLRAGVVPTFMGMAEEARADDEPPEFVCVIFNSWSGDPIVGLKDAIRIAFQETFTLDRAIEEEAQPLSEYCRAVTVKFKVTLAIILDQFDEYFLYHPYERGPGTFFSEFPLLVNDPTARVNFLISIRDDSLSALDRFKGHVPRLFKNYLRVRPLGIEAAARTIREPLKRRSVPVEIEDDLVKHVLDSVRADRELLSDPAAPAPAEHNEISGVVEAPFLQLVMTRVWNAERQQFDESTPGLLSRLLGRATGQSDRTMILRDSTLTRLGGAEQIVRNHVEHILMDSFKPSEQNIARKLFYYLVTPSQTKIAYTAADLASCDL